MSTFGRPYLSQIGAFQTNGNLIYSLEESSIFYNEVADIYILGQWIEPYWIRIGILLLTDGQSTKTRVSGPQAKIPPDN